MGHGALPVRGRRGHQQCPRRRDGRSRPPVQQCRAPHHHEPPLGRSGRIRQRGHLVGHLRRHAAARSAVEKADLDQVADLNFELADTSLLFHLFDLYEAEAVRVIELGFVLPAYDYVLKCSHTFNLLDARGAISVSERTAFIGRVRTMARLCAQGYLEQREKLGFPLLKGGK